MSKVVDFHLQSGMAIASLHKIIEKLDSEERLDIEITSDYLKITLNDKSYIISKQYTTSQIWIASPISGSIRVDYDISSEQWLYRKRTIEDFVADEIRAILL